ncbi:anaphase-promoting complex subunit 2-like isoform X2 [Rhopilema esculentum]|uniref:anaphase-promoting complex subunit 2-like isoform X2 n=1 Tax=Rhopilema esculentum TaxID=499914 RepID=UPI0031D68B77
MASFQPNLLAQYDEHFKARLLNDYCPLFWHNFPEWDNQALSTVSHKVLQVFQTFHANILIHAADGVSERRDLALARAALLLNETKDSRQFIINYFIAAFKCYKSTSAKDQQGLDTDNESEDCDACSRESILCCCDEIVSNFQDLCSCLRALGLLEHIASTSLAAVIYSQMKEYLEGLCKDEFHKHFLVEAMQWVEDQIISWLRLVIGDINDQGDSLESDLLSVESWRPKLEYFLCKVYAELRIAQLFEIIVEFPESLPSIEDLRECLEKTESRSLLTKSLKEAFRNRLLQAAVNTVDILTQYISTIRALRALEPSGVILENVCEPLREYLRTREDTIRCIIMSLTDQDSGTDLAEELIASEPVPIDVVDDADSDSDGEDWMPEPVDADIGMSSKSQRTSDIISMLVNIYGSKDLFVSEYRALLADRIFSSYSYDVTNERRYLELLKRRFGEVYLHFCDIMLKDVQDSQRMNRHIKDQLAKKDDETVSDVDFDAFILSSVYWPVFKEDQVTAPPEIESVMKSYTKEFETLKGMRTLQWVGHLGEVELDIELEDGTKSFKVNPGQATIIMLFQDKETLTTSEICSELQISTSVARSRISYWLGQGVVSEVSPDVFNVSKSCTSSVKETSFYEEDDESITASAQSQKDEELQMYWSYVVGMLTNIGALSIERIHSMLKMFAVTGPTGSQCTLEDVKKFLESKVKSGELLLSGGLYKLVKSE